ncbi:gluconate 2-dehydrogenase subunit 3 family protein [soil metagenome]
MSEISRREVIKVLGLVPLAGALASCSSPETDRAARAAAAAGEGGITAGPGLQFFTAHEDETVRVLVDYLIPRDEHSGSATDARVPEFMDFILADEKTTSPEQRIALRGGLAWLDAECQRRHGATFVQASDEQRRGVLDDIAWPARARPEMSQGVAFFNRFRDLTATGFYTSEMGYRDLQYIGNTAIPVWNGCPEEALRRLGVSYTALPGR